MLPALFEETFSYFCNDLTKSNTNREILTLRSQDRNSVGINILKNRNKTKKCLNNHGWTSRQLISLIVCQSLSFSSCTTSIVLVSLCLGPQPSSSSYPTRRFKIGVLLACTRAVCLLLVASCYCIFIIEYQATRLIEHRGHTFLNESSRTVNPTNDTSSLVAPPFKATHCTTVWVSTMSPIAKADVLAGSKLGV